MFNSEVILHEVSVFQGTIQLYPARKLSSYLFLLGRYLVIVLQEHFKFIVDEA